MHGHVAIPADLVSAEQRGSEAQKTAANGWSKTSSFDDTDADGVALRERIGARASALSIEERLAVRAAVKTLSETAQRVLALVIDGDMTSAAAAKILGVSEQAVRARCKRSLATLKPILEKLLG